VVLHNANAIFPAGLKLRFDRGRVFFDVDTLEEAGGYPAGDYLHIGVFGDCKVEEVGSREVKPHMDIYMPLTELDSILKMLKGLKTGKTIERLDEVM